MADILSKYKKEQNIKNIGIIITSLALALALNIYVGNTSFGQSLKGSVLEAQVNAETKADIYLEKNEKSVENIITLKSSQNITGVKNMSVSFVYNQDAMNIKNKMKELKDVEVLDLVNSDGYNTIILNFKYPTDIKAGDTILKVVVDKKSKDIESINMIGANFTDSKENTYKLSTSGVSF